MGKKKKPFSVSRVRKPPPSQPTKTVGPASKLPTPAFESLAPEILREGLQTVEKLQQGDCSMALKMIRKSISNHGGLPHLHFLEALVHHRLIEKSAKYSKDKLMYLAKAISSAKSAWEMLPNSLSFALLLIDILYQRAILYEEWGFVIQQCEKALNIENPTDPGVDKFLEEDEMQNSSKESRIEHEKRQIFKYLQASMHHACLKQSPKEFENAEEAANDNPIILDKEIAKLRMKEMEAIIGDWIVNKQRASLLGIMNAKGNAEKAKKYKGFWSSTLSAEKKEHILKVQIEKLENHFNSLDHYLAADLRGAISFAKENRTWKYWECCNEKFGYCNMFRIHLRESHGSTLELEERKVRREWIEIISKGEWKPMASIMARDFIINQLNFDFIPFDAVYESGCSGKGSYAGKDMAGTVSKNEGVEDSVHTNVSSRTYMDTQKWPSCVDKNREEILEKIRQGIHLLLKNNCLAMTHLHWPILYAMNKFNIVIPLSYLSPKHLKYICFLLASHLEDLLKFFDQLADLCGLNENHEMGSNMDDYVMDDTESETKERVRFSEDFSHLLVNENNVLLENEDLVSWMYEGLMTGEDIESQIFLRNYQREMAKLVCQIYQVESSHLQTFCRSDENVDSLSKIETIKVLERIYYEGPEKMENDQGLVAHFFSNPLMKGHKDIQSYDIAFITESEAVSSILNDVLAATSSYQSGLQECIPEDQLRKQKERLKKIDNHLRLTLQKILEKLIEDVAFVDALGLRCAADMQKYEPVLEKITCYDYQSIIVPLLASYLQTNLENQFHEYAAAAFLAELDAKECTEKGHDNARKRQKNIRNNKKKANLRMAEESKGNNGCNNSYLLLKDVEDGNVNPDIGASMSFENMKESIATDERLPEEYSEDHNKSDTHLVYKVNGNVNPDIGASMSFENMKESIATDARLPEEYSEDHNKSETHLVFKVNGNVNPDIGASMSFENVKESIATDERLPEEYSEDHNKSETHLVFKVNVLGVGVKYEAFDSFINVTIRSLWYLIDFRYELMRRSKACHEHMHKNACIFCAIKRIFDALSKASADTDGEAIDLSRLRTVLISHTSFFKKEEMRNAFDCVRVILESLHDSIISVLNPEDRHDCFIADCFVHRIFGWDHHERIYCGDCDLESGHQKTTSLFFILNAIDLIMMKAEEAHRDSSFDKLLKLVQLNGRMTCSHCGKWNDIYHSIRCLPPVFTMVLAWPKQIESSEDISITLSAISAELNLSVLFQGHHSDSEYFLVSMVCFYGDQEHYVCFNYNQELKQYVLYNDSLVEVTGSWEDVVDTCKTESLQPSILFFNQKSKMKFDHLQSH